MSTHVDTKGGCSKLELLTLYTDITTCTPAVWYRGVQCAGQLQPRQPNHDWPYPAGSSDWTRQRDNKH